MGKNTIDTIMKNMKENLPLKDLSGSGRGAPDPAFPLLFHENPASRTFFIALPNFVFSFQKIHLKRLISAKANKFKM